MSRGTSEPIQDESSSEWLLRTIEALQRLLQEVEDWPKSGDQLLSDLASFTSLPPNSTSDEDLDMLSIVVNDALSGIDVMKKYPNFYARILVNEELRTAFLETLELLEQSQNNELLEYSGPSTVDLSFLQKIKSQPIIHKSLKDKLVLTWQRTAEQLQNMFFMDSLTTSEVYRSDNYLLEENYINILHSQVDVDEQELEVRMDVLQTVTTPDDLKLMLVIFAPETFNRRFEATVKWGAYQQHAEINEYGLAKLPPLRAEQVFTPSGELIHGLELCLNQIN